MGKNKPCRNLKQSLPGRRDSGCQAPKAGMKLVGWKNSKEASGAKAN